MDIEITSILPLLAKTIVVLGLIVYTLFAGIVVRQEQLMSRTFEGASEPVIRLLAYIHLVAAVVVLLFGIVLL